MSGTITPALIGAVEALFAWAESTATDLRSTLDITDEQFFALVEVSQMGRTS
jgi:hypothetical protein